MSSNLQFQSFSNENFDMNSTNEQSFSGKIGDKNYLVEGDNVSTTGPKRNFFSFSFYQQYFDVDTDQVGKRILNSVIPTHKNFIAEYIQPMPDLYGPFWVCVTLVFSIGIFSNIAQYIEMRGEPGNYGSDFRMVSGASSLIASYVIIIPFLLYSLIWYRKSEIQYSYVEILCTYGYSLSIFIPVSMLWTIDSNLLRWVLILASVGLSSAVLVRALWPAFMNDSNRMISLGAMAGIVFFHFLLAFAFKEYFFDPVHARSVSVVPAPSGDLAPPPPGVDPTVDAPKIIGTLKPEVQNLLAANSTDVKKEESGEKKPAPVDATSAPASADAEKAKPAGTDKVKENDDKKDDNNEKKAKADEEKNRTNKEGDAKEEKKKQ